jgi:hypothetical protein
MAEDGRPKGATLARRCSGMIGGVTKVVIGVEDPDGNRFALVPKGQ